jgi:glycerol-3-phosphate O-acyltransferase
MEVISKRYRDDIIKMVQLSKLSHEVDEESVLQLGNKEILPYIEAIVEKHLLPGSRVLHPERIERLLAMAEKGESCLILPEHYSNFDLPCFIYLLKKAGDAGRRLADAIVAVAGIKLNETNPVVLAFTEAYTRVVIYPSRSLEIIRERFMEPREMLDEILKGTSINRAATKTINKIKKEGSVILVFPAGTRYRPWDPSTKKGVREIDSYLKTFDHMMLVSINGNILRINPEGEMDEDLIADDKVLFDLSEPIDCKEFRKEVKEGLNFGDDTKQMIVDEVMRRLDAMHDAVEATRLKDSGTA